jgi:hypothetical protein
LHNDGTVLHDLRIDEQPFIVEAGPGETVAAATADFPTCCLAALDHIPREKVIVIGPELDRAYRDVALANGAGGWLAREEVADRLGSEMRRVLGCRHEPCPPATTRRPDRLGRRARAVWPATSSTSPDLGATGSADQALDEVGPVGEVVRDTGHE